MTNNNRLLLDGRFSSLTHVIEFIEADIHRLEEFLMPWWGRTRKQLVPLPSPSGSVTPDPATIRATSVVPGTTLEEVLPALLPINISGSRALLVPTQNKEWVAHFTNSNGALLRAGAIALYLDTRALLIRYSPSTRHPPEKFDGYGIAHLEVFNGKGKQPFVDDPTEREILLHQDYYGWSFRTKGEPYPFEDIEHYKTHPIRNRFPLEMLKAYTEAMGLSVFDANFYMPEGSQAILILRWPDQGNYTLAETQEH